MPFYAVHRRGTREFYRELAPPRPEPDTEENEYREEYYERIAYANEHFASGIPGWKTDRGRIYITWGKPDESNRTLPAAPTTGRAMKAAVRRRPIRLKSWFYRILTVLVTALRSSLSIRPARGEYRIARDANEKDALLHVPGAGLTTAESLGLATRATGITGAWR